MGSASTLMSFPGFGRLLTGSVLGTVADRTYQVAVLTVVMVAYTDGSQQFAWIAAAGILAQFICYPLFSALVDRMDRRRLLWHICAAKALLVLLLIPILSQDSSTGFERVWPYLLALLFMMSFITVPFAPSRAAAIPDIVTEERRDSAASLIAGTGVAAILAGLLLGLIMTPWMGSTITIAGTAIALALAALLFRGLPDDVTRRGTSRTPETDKPSEEKADQEPEPQGLEGSYLHQTLEGFRFCWKCRGLLALLILEAGFWVCAVTYYILHEWHAGSVLHLQGNEKLLHFGLAFGCLGVGLLVGAPIMGKRCRSITPFASFPFAILLSGLAMGGVFWSNKVPGQIPYGMLPWLLALGFGGGLFLGRVDADLLTLTPAHLRGRVFACKGFFYTGALIVPVAFFSVTEETVGRQWTADYLPLMMVLSTFPCAILGWIVDAGLFGGPVVNVKMDRQERIAFALAKFIAWVLFKIWFRFEVVGREKVPTSGRLILAANHGSFLDPPLLGTGMPRFTQFLMYRSYYHSLGHPFFRLMMTVPVDETNQTQALKTMTKSLKQDVCVGVFPEGQVSYDGKLQKPESGVMFMAKLTGAPVVPVAIKGNVQAFPRQAAFPKPSKIKLIVGEIIHVPKRASRQDLAELTDQLMGQLADMLEMEPGPKCADEGPKNSDSNEEASKEISTSS